MSVQMPSPGWQSNCFSATRLPLGGGLHDLRVDGMLVAVVRDVELDRGARSVAVEHVVDAALGVDDQRNLDHHQVEFLAEIVFDVALADGKSPAAFLCGVSSGL